MKDEYYAHSLDGKPPEEWQRLEDTLKQVVEMVRSFAEAFWAGETAYLGSLTTAISGIVNAGLSFDLDQFRACLRGDPA